MRNIMCLFLVVLASCAESRAPAVDAGGSDAACVASERVAFYAARLVDCAPPPCALACDAACDSTLQNVTASGRESCADLWGVCTMHPQCAGAL